MGTRESALLPLMRSISVTISYNSVIALKGMVLHLGSARCDLYTYTTKQHHHSVLTTEQ